MKNKLFVSNISYKLRDDDLHEIFSKFGPIIEAKVIMDRQTQRSKGYAFVTFETEEAAAQAIAELNEKEVDGRTIYVREAVDKKPNE